MTNPQTTNSKSANSLQASEGSASASKPQAGKQHGKSKLTQSNGLCLVTDFPMPDSLKMSVKSQQKNFAQWIASQEVSPAPTSPTWGTEKKAASKDSKVSDPVYFRSSFVSPGKYNPAGWSLKTSRHCSIATIARTLKKSSAILPTAIMWDLQGCLMLNISESPKNAVAFSWSAVLEKCPPLTCWLMPHQWKLYLARLVRSSSHGGKRTAGLGILRRQPIRGHELTLAVSFSLLRKTDGIRWLSGKECLLRQGFPADWMTGTGQRLMQPEMPSVRKLLNGLRKN